MKLRLLAMVARLLGIELTYTIKFLPLNRQRTDFRGRTTASPDSLGEALAVFRDLANHPDARKEKTDGIYYLEIEAREGIVQHTVEEPDSASGPVATDRQGSLLQGLQEAPSNRSSAATASEAEATEPQGAAGTGTDRGHAAGLEALGRRAEVTPGLAQGPQGRPQGTLPPLDQRTSLDILGRR